MVLDPVQDMTFTWNKRNLVIDIILYIIHSQFLLFLFQMGFSKQLRKNQVSSLAARTALYPLLDLASPSDYQ